MDFQEAHIVELLESSGNKCGLRNCVYDEACR